MQPFMTYFIYALVCIAFLTPFIGFVIGATSIVKTTLATFAANFIAFITEESFLNKKIEEGDIWGKILKFLELHQTEEEKKLLLNEEK